MKMTFAERPYSGQSFRPRPEVHFDERSNLLIIATPWGAREAARKTIERMLNYLKLANEDSEATSPFERLSCLSGAANNLRVATLLANEAIYREDNQNEYKSGVELFACSFFENEFVWLQIGNPQILFCREKKSPMPLGGSTDLSFDMSEGENLLPPIPNVLLGLDSSINVTVGSQKIQPSDKIILISHSMLPSSVFQLSSEQMNLESLSQNMASQNQDLAFWIGVLQAS